MPVVINFSYWYNACSLFLPLVLMQQYFCIIVIQEPMMAPLPPQKSPSSRLATSMRKKAQNVWKKEAWNPSINAVDRGNNKKWSPNRHKLNAEGNMMVDDMVKSKKDTLWKLLCLEILFQWSLFGLKELIKDKKVKLRPVPFLGGGGEGTPKCWSVGRR